MEEVLVKNRLKVTACRLDLLNTIKVLGLNANLKNILNNLNYDKSTIYRNIDKLLNKKIIVKELSNDNIIFRINVSHKHILKCVNCHKENIIDYCPYDNNIMNNFKVLKHNEVIEGICINCQKK